MKTFPHINFNTMNTLYTKCKQIIEDLDNMIPEDTEASDWYSVTTTPPMSWVKVVGHSEGGDLFIIGKEFDPQGTILIGFKDGEISYNNLNWQSSRCLTDPDHPRNKVIRNGLQEFIVGYSCDVYSKVYSYMKDYKQQPEYSFHKTTYTSCKRILEVLKSESCVNTLNLELAAALQFIEELEESDWKDSLKTYDKDLVEADLEDLKQKAIDDAKEECKNNYETQIAEFKAKLEVLEKTPKKPEEESDERDKEVNPSFWESFKNMFK